MEILNAAPMVIDRGTNDLSPRQIAQPAETTPQHVPLFYGFFAKGKVGRQYVNFDAASLTQLYGDASFDVNGKYYTHQTPFLQEAARNANNCVVHRLMAPDAKDVANVVIYLDYVAAQVPLYVKNIDGSIKRNAQGQPEIVLDGSGDEMTVAGYKVCYVVESFENDLGTYAPGLATVRPGIQTEAGVQSQQIPLFEFSVSDPGSDGNNYAVRMFPSMESDVVPFPSLLLNEGKQYPYNFSLLRVVDQLTGRSQPVLNRFGAQSSSLSFKKGGVDPTSRAIIDADKVINDNYIGLPVATATGLGNVTVYSENLDTVLGLLYDAEKNISDTHRDLVINNTEDNRYAINVLGFTSSNGSPYQAIKLVDMAGTTRITRNTSLFLGGGSDGTIGEAVMDQLVAEDLDNYNNSLHEYNDLVKHRESIIYDSGFDLDTKFAFPKFISRRKDTFVVLSTFAWNAPSITLESHYSVALALKTMLDLYPESAFFGTKVTRGLVIAGSGKLVNSQYIKRVPNTLELLNKASAYMGSSNGFWKNGFLFDKAPGSILTRLVDIDVTWVPASTRNTLWSAGINFVLNYSERSQFFPAMQTVYDDDTSVLNSFFVAVAIGYLNRVEHAAWREFSGVMSMTEAQLTEAVNTFVSNNVQGRFDNLFTIIPDAHVTEFDSERGYSWTLNIKIGANNSRTVMTAMVSAYRMSDLQAA